MTNEEIISAFLQRNYLDQDLTALLAHTQDGKLSYWSCCCLVGIPTANHALRGAMHSLEASTEPHYVRAHDLPYADEAEDAFLSIGFNDSDERGRAALIPLIRAEIERRERERSKYSSPVDLQVVSV